VHALQGGGSTKEDVKALADENHDTLDGQSSEGKREKRTYHSFCFDIPYAASLVTASTDREVAAYISTNNNVAAGSSKSRP